MCVCVCLCVVHRFFVSIKYLEEIFGGGGMWWQARGMRKRAHFSIIVSIERLIEKLHSQIRVRIDSKLRKHVHERKKKKKDTKKTSILNNLRKKAMICYLA